MAVTLKFIYCDGIKSLGSVKGREIVLHVVGYIVLFSSNVLGFHIILCCS